MSKPLFKIGETVIHQGDERMIDGIYGRMNIEGDGLCACTHYIYIVRNPRGIICDYAGEGHLEKIDERA